MRHVLLSVLVVCIFASQVAVGTAVSKRVASRIANVVNNKVAPLVVVGAVCLSLVGCELQQQMAPQFTASDKPSKVAPPVVETPQWLHLIRVGIGRPSVEV